MFKNYRYRQRMHISLHIVIVVFRPFKRRTKVEMPGDKSGSCRWNSEYSKTFPGITSAKNGKTNYCHCTHCGKDLSIKHKGRADIEKHLKTKEHIANTIKVAGTLTLDKLFSGNSLQFSMFTRILSNHFLRLTFSFQLIISLATKVSLENAAKEALWCYHKIHKIQSFASSDCESQIFREVFKQKEFHLGRSKCAAISSNVFAPKIVEEMKQELKSCNFVSIATDASNHNAVKMFPVIARWFSPVNGLNNKVLDLTNQKGSSMKLFDCCDSTVMNN